MLMIRFENGTTKSTDDGFPRFVVNGDAAKPRHGLHVRHRGAAPAPRAHPRHRLAPPHPASLLHQQTQTNHITPPLQQQHYSLLFSL